MRASVLAIVGLLLADVVSASMLFADPEVSEPIRPPGYTPPKPPKKWTTMVTVTETISSQCGGAAYRPELDDVRPLEGATYLVRRGAKNTPSKVLAQATTDSAGHLYFNLPKGTYCLITPDKKDVSNKKAPNDDGALVAPPVAPPTKTIGPPIGSQAADVSTPGLSNEEKKWCDLIISAPTKTARLGRFRSTCRPLGPGESPPP